MPNYELEAAGLGMWRAGQEQLTEPYVDRYFDELPDTVDVRQRLGAGDRRRGVLPDHSLTDKTWTRARELIDADGLDLPLRRTVVDRADDLARRIAVRQAVPAPMSDRPRRPGPTVRVRVRELTDDGETPPRGPGRDRGAARDPAGLAGRRRAGSG